MEVVQAVKSDSIDKDYPGPHPSISRLLPRLAPALPQHGAATGARSARVAGLLPLSQTSVEKAAQRQHHRALLRRSPAKNTAHGLLRQRQTSRPNHLLHLPEIQSGMENAHSPRVYTSGLTVTLPAVDVDCVLVLEYNPAAC